MPRRPGLGTSSSWNTSPEPTWRRWSVATVRCRSPWRASTFARPPLAWSTPTNTAWFTATSRRETSCSPSKGESKSSTSDWPISPAAPRAADRLATNDTLLGSVDCMAPEQAADPHTADVRADIYGLGCTLYFLLAGHPPFPTGTLDEKLAAHAQATPPAIETLREDVPPALPAIVRSHAGQIARRSIPDTGRSGSRPGTVCRLGRNGQLSPGNIAHQPAALDCWCCRGTGRRDGPLVVDTTHAVGRFARTERGPACVS